MISGIKASEGVAIGTAKVLTEVKIEYDEKSLLTAEDELIRYQNAKETGINRLNLLKEKTLNEIGEAESEVFEAHKQLLCDPVMEKEILSLIKQNCTSEHTYFTVMNKYIEIFKNLDNEYMRERALDLKDILTNQLKALSGHVELQQESQKNSIIVTFDLTPSETVNLDRNTTIGFVTEIGGETSHSAIIARTLGIPAVVGIGVAINEIVDGDILILDGTVGQIIVNPDEETISVYRLKQEALKLEKDALNKYLNQPSITLDGKTIELSCNIAGIDDVDMVLEKTADGIGLFRSEFLYMNRTSLPNEEDQYQAYKSVLEKMNPRPVTIRTMDIGGDKELDYLELDKEMNPFLGYRAIRICLQEKEIFKTQLKALFRASVFGHLRIMFPMISCLEELLEAKIIVEEVKETLKSNGISYSDHVEIGIMIEIPAAALMADVLAKEVDFFSIGTNDLIQYTTAVDRMNSKIAELYTPYHPAFLRLVKNVIEAGHKENIVVGMCGNVAGYPEFIPTLLDMGLDEFSMSPDALLKARAITNDHKNNEKRLINIMSLYKIEDLKKALKKD